MKFCKYCASSDELEEYEYKHNCFVEDRDILTKDESLKINGIPFADVWVAIDYDSNILSIHITDANNILNEYFHGRKRIKYCPMCGRKIKKAQD